MQWAQQAVFDSMVELKLAGRQLEDRAYTMNALFRGMGIAHILGHVHPAEFTLIAQSFGWGFDGQFWYKPGSRLLLSMQAKAAKRAYEIAELDALWEVPCGNL